MKQYERVQEAASLARAVRVMAKLGFFDPACHASVRTDSGVLITPDFDAPGTPSPRVLRAGDLVELDHSAQDDSTRGKVASFHRTLYEARADVGAVLFAYPPVTMASVATRRPLRKITHAEAWMVETVAPFVDAITYLDEPKAVAGLIGRQHRIVPVTGVGVAFLAPEIDVAISNAYSYEYLARMNLLAASLPAQPREATDEEIQTIQAERATPETVGSVDGRAFLRSFDRSSTEAPLADDGTVNTRMALSCRILAAQRTLVGFYEHVSHRLDGQGAFAMSPAKNFAQIRPEDILVVGLDDEATWISGSHPPAPFRRFHRDILLARPDVKAIVHTHEMYGRVFTGASIRLQVLDRYAVGTPPSPPRLGRASMVFEAADRRVAVEVLGGAALYHTDLHGTDYVAGTIEAATVAAIHREHAYRTQHTALRLGEPVPLTDEEVRALDEFQPSDQAWWRFYCDLLQDENGDLFPGGEW